MNLKQRLRKILWNINLDIVRFRGSNNPLAVRKKLLEAYGISLIIDVGANTGQYVNEMRNDVGFSGKIISFEPISLAFEQLKRNASNDNLWEVRNCALGDVNCM